MSPPKNPHNLTSAQFLGNPYVVYEQLRRDLPVCWDERLGFWLVSRYADVHAGLRDHRLSSAQLTEVMGRLPEGEREEARPLKEILTGRLLLTDDPDHRRIRMLMQLAFTPRQVERMRAEIQQTIDELLSPCTASGSFDLIADFSDPLPAHVIAAMLGIPAGDRQLFKKWTDDIYAFMGVSAEPISARAKRATESAVQLRSHLAALFAEARRQPREDLLSAMVAAEGEGARLSETELFANVVGMINAAHETTANLIGNTVLNLLRNPDQWQKLLGEASLCENAIEEGLRYDPPIQMLGRRASVDIELHGVIIPAGQQVALILGAANRDPDQFADPNRFDITRPDIKHVAFGGGPHFCLGAALGRLEGQMALATLISRFPNLRLTDKPIAWRPYPVFRGLRGLPLLVK
ncbi:MAG: cytochrome P450 [Planctomycetales bacterium]|nr:cytochrome P450 [Planctomycetales bacterium]